MKKDFSIMWKILKPAPALLVILICFVSPAAAIESDAESFMLFPRQRLFAPRIADPVEVQLSARVRMARQEFIGNIGYSVGLLQFQLLHIHLQLRVEGNTFVVLKMQTPDFPLQSTDYSIAFPLDFRAGRFSSRLMWVHISSHLGDDFNRIDDINNSIIDNRGERPGFSKPNKFSREFMKLFGAANTENTRLYAGIDWAYHVVENRLQRKENNPWSLQAGFEWRLRKHQNLIFPFMAIDIKSRQEFNWSLDLNFQTGIAIGRSGLRRMRVAIEIFNGYSSQGQFLSRKEKDLNLVVAFDF